MYRQPSILWNGRSEKIPLKKLVFKTDVFLFQQLDLITPFQLYFNPDLILRHYQVSVFTDTEFDNSISQMLIL